MTETMLSCILLYGLSVGLALFFLFGALAQMTGNTCCWSKTDTINSRTFPRSRPTAACSIFFDHYFYICILLTSGTGQSSIQTL